MTDRYQKLREIVASAEAHAYLKDAMYALISEVELLAKDVERLKQQ